MDDGGRVEVGEHVAEAFEAPAPEVLEPVEHHSRVADTARVGAHDLLATALLLRDEVCPLEDGDVLLHSGEAHRVDPREGGNGVLALPGERDDVPAGGVGEGVEQEIDLRLIPLITQIYNHVVAC